MTAGLRTDDPLPSSVLRSRRRAAWRQRLIEAERGIAQGFRGDSTLFVHLFAASVVVAAGLVLGLSAVQWTLIVLASSIVIAAEMFHKALRVLVAALGDQHGRTAAETLRIATAAVFVTILGTAITLALTFGQRIAQLAAG